MRTTDLVLDALAVYRLTRLVTADTITAEARDEVVREAYHAQAGSQGRSLRDRLADQAVAEPQQLDEAPPGTWSEFAQDDPHAPKLATLVTCRWCAGVWVAAGVVAARRLTPRAWAPLGRLLALSCAGPLLARLEGEP